LTPCIPSIMGGTQVPTPLVQILNVGVIRGMSKPQSNPNQEHYRMSISDGSHSCVVMLATQCNGMVLDGTITQHSVVRLTEYIINEVRGKRIVIVLKMEVMGGPLDAVIGTPTDFDSGAENVAPQHQQQQAQHQQQPKQEPAYKPPQQQPQVHPQQPQYEGEDISQHRLLPIKLLTPYRQRWTIKGRCTYKSAIKPYQSERGNGTVARIHLLGEDTGEIEATLWREAVDKFYEVFEVGKVYYISKGTVKQANKRYSNVNNDYTITIETWSIVQPAAEDGTIKNAQYDFVSIADIANMHPDATVDVFGIMIEIGEATPLTTKAGKDTFRRNIKLADKTGSAIELTLWGDQATAPGMNFDQALNCVLAIKSARVSAFNDKSLSSGFASILQLSPDLPECHELKAWFDSQGQETSFAQISQPRGGEGGGGGGGSSELKTIAQMKQEAAMSTNATYFTVKLTVALFGKEHNVYYPACSKCNKKVNQVGDVWRCEHCDANYDTPDYRYILSCNASDHTGSQWINSFDDVAKQLLGIDAKTLNEQRDEPAYDAVFDEAVFKSYKFRIRAKQETYQDDTRLKYVVHRIFPMDYVQDTANLIEEINKYG